MWRLVRIKEELRTEEDNAVEDPTSHIGDKSDVEELNKFCESLGMSLTRGRS